jgi:hypothetical protein
MKAEDPLDRLFAAARADEPDTARLDLGFESRVLARIREERTGSWFAWAMRMCPYFAALALAAGAWAYLNSDGLPESESLTAALREGGVPVFDYFLGGEE